MIHGGPPEQGCLLSQLRVRLVIGDEVPEALAQPLVALRPAGEPRLRRVLTDRTVGKVAASLDWSIMCGGSSVQEHAQLRPSQKTVDRATCCQHQFSIGLNLVHVPSNADISCIMSGDVVQARVSELAR